MGLCACICGVKGNTFSGGSVVSEGSGMVRGQGSQRSGHYVSGLPRIERWST